MNRFKFRGICKETGEFVYGFYAKGKDTHWIIESLDHQVSSYWDVIGAHEVHGFTVGISSGLKDSNEVEIFEGDIVETSCGDLYRVVYDDSSVSLMFYNNPYFESFDDFFPTNTVEVVGNIHGNSGLLEQ